MHPANLKPALAPVALLAATLAAAAPTFAAELEASLVIRNHRFEPTEIKVPANQRVKLSVHNQDKTPEEFESHALKREKVIPGGATAVIYIGPLKPGRYAFVGEFHDSTARGAVVVE